LVARYRDRVGFRLLHYCLMSNHFHLFVKLPDPRQVSMLMAGLLRDELASEAQERQDVVYNQKGYHFGKPVVTSGAVAARCDRWD
jgi:REP element-mobilizing transposase RayT